MRKEKLDRLVCGALCAAMLAQPLTASAAWWETPAPAEAYGIESPLVPLAETPAFTLRDGTAVIPSGTGLDAVKQLLAEALIGPGVDGSGLEWEYYCEGKSGLLKNNAWVSISGGTSKNGLLTYTHPALADNGDGDYQVRLAGTTAEVTLTKLSEEPLKVSSITLNEGVSAAIPYDESGSINFDALRENIFAAAVAGTTPDMTAGDVRIEYYATPKVNIGGAGIKRWAPLDGGWVSGLEYPAISAGTHQVRFTYSGEGYTDAAAETTVTLTARAEAAIAAPNGAPVSLPYNDDLSVNYAWLEQDIRALFVSAEGIDLSNAAIEYYATAQSGSLGDIGEKWMPLSGGKDGILEYPGMGEGTHRVRLTWPGNGQYAPAAVEGTVVVSEREAAPYTLSDPAGSVKLPLNEDLSVNYETLKGMIFNAVVAQSDVLTAENVTIEYYAAAKTGNVGGLGKAWAPLNGGKISGLEYPGIPAGTQSIRISWPGSRQYAPTTIEASVEVFDREALQVTLHEAPYEVGMVFNAGQGYDYDATIRAIYDAVVASTEPSVSYDTAVMEYTTQLDALGINFKPLSHQGATGLLDFKDGTWKIRISWPETLQYRGASVTVEVTTTDNRIASAVVLKEGASFTYNMDPSVMERAIFEQVIDWENSTLPEGADISHFDIQYKAQMNVLDDTVDADKIGGIISGIPGLEGVGGSIGDIAGSLGETTKRFMPISGGVYLGVPYAPMGAGQHQVQVAFKGSADYKPSGAAEASVTVNKANVKVKVHSDNIHAGDPLPAGFITTDPADKFEFYTIYAGATSNVSLGIYLDLPDKYDNNKLIKVIDPVVEKIAGRSFSKMLQDGVTLGELRQIFNSAELIELLEKVGVDTGAFGQIIKAASALPSITDSVRISFGTPNRAGLYTATVITDNKNYNTGVGVGALLVRMHLKGVQLTWNQELGKKISAAEAKDFDWGVTLSNDGDVTIDQSSVHYLYSGFTSKWKPYSSTTTPPTEPGRYAVTVVTLGGNYQAAPITRSYQITK